MLSHRQIGKASEILVQYRLLRLGVESSQMTTDAGVGVAAQLMGALHARVDYGSPE